MALLCTAIGACFFAFKDSLSYLAIAVGILVILLAAFLGLLALADKSRGASFFFKLVFAVVTLAAGVTTLIARDTAISVIIGIFGLVLIMDGSFKFHTAAMSKRYSLFGWWFIAILSVLIIAAGYITVRTLRENTPATMYFLGASLIGDSVANFFSAFYTGSYQRRHDKDIRSNVLAELKAKTKDEESAEASSGDNA